jgi:hypothetical protein
MNPAANQFPETAEYPMSYHPNREILPSLLSALALCNPSTFAETRNQILYTIARIPISHSYKENVSEQIILPFVTIARFNPLTKKLEKGLAPEKKSRLQDITTRFLEEKTTAYETVGAIKELANENKQKLSPKQMSTLWAKLSLLQALKHHKPETPLVDPLENWEEKTYHESLLPTQTTLEESFKTPTAKKYTEAKPHLNTFTPNWPEILLQLPPHLTAGVKALLQADPKNPNKETITNAFLWPSPNHTEIENRRLARLLTQINSHPKGRESRYQSVQKILGHLDPNTPSLRKTLPKKEDHRIQRLLDSCILFEQTNNPYTSRIERAYNSVAFLTSPKAKAALKKAENLIENSIKNETTLIRSSHSTNEEKINPYRTLVSKLGRKYQNHTTLLRLSPANLKTDNERLQTIKALAEAIENPEKAKPKNHSITEILAQNAAPKSAQNTYTNELRISKLLLRLENPEEHKNTLNNAPFTHSTVIQAFLNNKPTGHKIFPSHYLIECLQKNKQPDLKKTYGNNKKTLIQTSCSYPREQGNKLKIYSAIQAFKKENLSLNIPDTLGNTALHYSAPSATKLLLKKGANIQAKNQEGLTPLDTNKNPTSQKLIQDHFKTLKKLLSLQNAQKSQNSTNPPTMP